MVMNDTYLQVNSRVRIPSWELVFTASRSSGAGGQHVNKTSSRITLHWSIRDTSALTEFLKKRVLKNLGTRVSREGVLQLHVEDHRSQYRNKEMAKERLVALLTEALKVPKSRQATKPTRASKRRRVDEKKQRGALKELRKKIRD